MSHGPWLFETSKDNSTLFDQRISVQGQCMWQLKLLAFHLSEFCLKQF